MSELEAPEAVSVYVATDDEPTARLVGPMLAAKLYPGRRFGAVLYIERWPETAPEPYGFEVSVAVKED